MPKATAGCSVKRTFSKQIGFLRDFTMDSIFYESKLPNHKIFNDLKESVLKNPHGKLRNLMELKDDVLYVWNPDGNFLMCLNLKHCEEHQDETPYQKINLVSPPAFAVERLLGSRCGSRLCAWGARGVLVAELPPRWGRASLFDSGSPAVLCKSHSLDERLLYSQGEVRRVHWHPVSLSHVLVLVSDNTIRLYNIAVRGGPKLVKVYPIGPKPTSLLAGKTILESLGDTAVDFTPVPDSSSLLILRGNGDVYMIECDLDAKTPLPLAPKMWGPLAMYPPADDNYGSESCSITALGGGDTPALVVVATCSAALYHCLLLPSQPTDRDDGGDSHALYVVEAVELNITLNPDDNDMQYSYPVHLYPCTSNAYACVHAGGVHSVTLPILHQLKEYSSVDDAETESMLASICVARSVARHLVCTAPHPPAGLALTAPPLPRLLLLCADCTLLTRTLEPFDLEEQLYKEFQLKNPALEQDDINKLLQERQKLSFTSIIQEILTREVSQPILNIQKSEEPSPKECLELFTQATMKLRTEYMTRQKRATTAITRKLVALRSLADQHNQWYDELKGDIDALQLQSTTLVEKCALAEKYQDDLKYRCSNVVRGIRAGAAPSAAEREQLDALRAHARVAEDLADQLQQLKQHARRKSRELKKWEEEYKKKDAVLGKSHSDTIQMILQQQTSQISTLIEDTKLLKDQLNIV